MYIIKLKFGKYNSTFYSKREKENDAIKDLLAILAKKFENTPFKILTIIKNERVI